MAIYCIFLENERNMCLHGCGAQSLKKNTRSVIFLLKNLLPKCPASPCSSFGGNPLAGRAEVTKKNAHLQISAMKNANVQINVSKSSRGKDL